jgi:hypothetical protein
VADSKEVLVDDGYVTVQIGQVEAQVDLFQAFNKIVQIGSDQKDPTAYHDAIRQYMVQLGLPPGSDKLAVAFVERICDRVNALKKKDGEDETPKSPASTT